MTARFREAIEKRWYGRVGWLLVFWPLMVIFRLLAAVRRAALQRRQEALDVPVIVIGNITVGGTGKTPLLIALTRLLQSAGLRPGVISRGYGARLGATSVRLVQTADSSADVGDEPLLIARSTQCPVVVGKDRAAAARALLAETDCDVILSDDGLQHYALSRNVEIVVVDGSRGFGNGYCLPCGPLREPIARLQHVDWVIRNGSQPNVQLVPWSPVPMHIKPMHWVNLLTGEQRPVADSGWLQEPAYAVAGIGNPQRFFSTLSALGVTFFPKPFPDHHNYTPHDFAAFTEGTVLMTAKDAVKCTAFARSDWWYLEVTAELPESFQTAFVAKVRELASPVASR